MAGKPPTKKHLAFVSGPIGNKRVLELPGVGKANADLLVKKGYTKASHVLSKFISPEVNKDKAKFRDAIQPYSALNSEQFDQLYNGLKDYTEQNM